MGNYSNPNAGRAEIAAEFLRIAARDLATATLARIRYIGLARQYGVTNAAIADALGVTEKAVRGLIGRNSGIINEPECSVCGDGVAPGYYCPECGLYNGGEE